MFRLPEGWSSPELISDVVVVDGVEVHRAGVSTVGGDGEEICGAAAGAEGPTVDRAWFELLERVSCVEALKKPAAFYDVADSLGTGEARWARSEIFPESDAPERWRYARSNGIALHADYSSASRRAFWELAERDRLIRSWHGEILPEPFEHDELAKLARAKSYLWRAYAFPDDEPGSFSDGVDVVGVFGFPRRDDVPFVLGFGGRPDRASAVAAAAAEALQLLAFLWGEPIPDAEPPATAPGASRHLDRYQVKGAHEVVRRWLEGGHARYAVRRERRGLPGRVGFVDVTPAWLAAGFRVIKAVCRDAVPLVFGDSPFAGHLPNDLRLHPIP